MEEENITPESLPGTEQSAPAADGVEAVSNDAITLAEIEATLGKKFPTKEAALKSWKDTNSFVGQKVAPQPMVPPDVLSKVESLEQTVRETSFYAEHPEYKGVKDLISSLGKNPEEVVNTDVFKKAYTAMKASEDSEKSKSVLHSNPRLGQVTDKMTQAQEAAKAGNHEAAKAAAVSAVLDSLE